MLHRVVAQEKLYEPRIGLRFALRLVEMVERVVHFLHRAEWPLHFPLGAGGHTSAIAAPGHVGPHVHAQIRHDLLKDETARDRTVIHREHVRDTLEGKGLDVFGGHRGTEKAQGGLDILAVDPVILLVGDPTAVIHHAIEHEEGTATAFLHPDGRLDVLEIGGAQIELPALIAVLGLKPDGRRLLQQRGAVIAPTFEVAIDRRLGQEGRWRLHMAFRGLNAVGLHKPDRFRGGQMPAFRVRRAQFDRRNEFTVALELLAGHDPRLAPVSAVEGPWPKALSQTPIQRVFRHPIELRGVTHHLTSFWTAQRQGTQPSP